MSNAPEEERKIIIDEDWKSQVEREKRQWKQQDEAPTEGAAAAEPTEQGTWPEEVTVQEVEGHLPEASFELLITTLATQTLACLGQIEDPLEHKPIVRLELAQHHIDMLDMLETKTRGNLTADESRALQGLLDQLRMIYLAVRRQLGK
jgi:Domain of unknown function (DUF1844)